MPGNIRDSDKDLMLKIQKSRYGLGDRRSLQQAITFSGIDTVNRVILSNRYNNKNKTSIDNSIKTY